MRFRIFLFFWSFLLPSMSQAIVHPLGIVIRKSVLTKVTEDLSNQKSRGEKIRKILCLNNEHYLDLSFSAIWSEPKWVEKPDGKISLSAQISQFRADGLYLKGCRKDSLTSEITITAPPPHSFRNAILEIGQGVFSFTLDPANMLVSVNEPDLASVISTTKFTIPSAPEITMNLNAEGILAGAVRELLNQAKEYLNTWLPKQLRGFVFVQAAGEVLKDNPIWNAGKLMQKGAITLELAEPSVSQRFLTFAFSPFQTDSFFASPSGLELYFNAQFLNLSNLRELSRLEPLQETSLQYVLARTQKALADPNRWSKESFARPELYASPYDLALVIPPSLPNDAWTNFYQERFLNVRTILATGSQTKGLIAEEEQDVKEIITISPESTPQMTFEANNFQFEVKDFVMNMGMWIEDRYIPSTQLRSQVRISADLKVDPIKQMVKMSLDPQRFDIKLKSVKGRPIDDDGIALLENTTNALWRDFFTNNGDFEIFPTVFNSENIPVEIKQVSISGTSIILDADLKIRGPAQ